MERAGACHHSDLYSTSGSISLIHSHLTHRHEGAFPFNNLRNPLRQSLPLKARDTVPEEENQLKVGESPKCSILLTRLKSPQEQGQPLLHDCSLKA